MADNIKTIQQVMIKDETGQWSGPYPLSVLADYIVHNGHALADILGAYDPNDIGNIASVLKLIWNGDERWPGKPVIDREGDLRIQIGEAKPERGPVIWIETKNQGG